ncbi:MAG TPA: response regulator [Thermomicrobiales bacterium]
MAAPREHVLVVDDLPEFLAVVQEVLEEEGLQVTTWLSPPNDLESVLELHPDVIVLDFVIAGAETGLVFLERLKGDPRTASVPVVVCTAAIRQVERLHDQLEAWHCRVLLKPFEIEDLLSAIGDSLAERKSGSDGGAVA